MTIQISAPLPITQAELDAESRRQEAIKWALKVKRGRKMFARFKVMDATTDALRVGAAE